jgi:Tol biopolymer transport system component/DNA-binding winged helix-turn-helix (wHTH) protein
LKEPIPKRTKHFYSFGPFRLYVAERELFREAQPVDLPPKALDALFLLVSKRGHVVDKDELMKRLWPDTFVEEANLGYQISQLRKALGETPEGKPYVDTIARRGYRFAAGVTESWEEERAPTRLAVAGLGEEEARVAGRRRRLAWLVSAACVLVIGAGVGGWLLFFRPAPQPEMRPVPFTNLLGPESYPTISPDGKMVAFCWTGEKERRPPVLSSIYVQQVGSETAMRRTDSPTYDFGPAWSPDSRRIAFCRLVREGKGENTGFTIHRMDALGGPEFEVGRSLAGSVPWWRHVRRLAWSPDDKFLAVADEPPGEKSSSIYLLSMQTRERRRLTSPPPGYDGDFGPAFSPDGRGIMFAAGGDMWRIPVSGGEPERLNVGDRVAHPSVSREGEHLVYVTRDQDFDLWRVRGPNAAPAESPGKPSSPERLFSSTAWDMSPKYSPDGKQIVFSSLRGGAWRIWRCDSDGSDCLPLTSVPGGYPRWSPDGRSIAFLSRAEEEPGNFDIFVVSAEGGEPRRVTFHGAQDLYASWSRDGRWIYFGSNRSDDWQIWKIPSEGGDAVRVTRNGGMDGYESADGRLLYYAKGARGIWRIPVEGGEETKVLDHGEETNWELLEDGICFRANPPEGTIVKFFRFSTDRIETVREFPKGTAIHDFAVSPDGQWGLCTLVERYESDIMLVENFR